MKTLSRILGFLTPKRLRAKSDHGKWLIGFPGDPPKLERVTCIYYTGVLTKKQIAELRDLWNKRFSTPQQPTLPS